MIKKIIFTAFLLLALILAGCAASDSSMDKSSGEDNVVSDYDNVGGGVNDNSEPGNYSDDEMKSDEKSTVSQDEDGSSDFSDSDIPEKREGEELGTISGQEGEDSYSVPPGDLLNWSDWIDLTEDFQYGPVIADWGIGATERFYVRVVTEGGVVPDALVTLSDSDGEVLWRTRSDNNGTANLFSSVFTLVPEKEEYDISVSVAGQEPVLFEDVSQRQKEPLELKVNSSGNPSYNLDLMFVIDTTVSMDDELQYMKNKMLDIVNSVKQKNSSFLNVRLSCNYYRDEDSDSEDSEDNYIVRSEPFDTDIEKVVRELAEQKTSGGGDYEEAVEKALSDAVSEHEWSESAIARIMFILLDAPAHQNDAVLEVLHSSIKSAAEKGIRIIPIVSSNSDKQTEFLMRSIDIVTGGTYVFLTDFESGDSLNHGKPTVGEYEVQYLNDLIIRLINERVKLY